MSSYGAPETALPHTHKLCQECILFCKGSRHSVTALAYVHIFFSKIAEGVDFIALTEHQDSEVTITEEAQRRCTFYEILDDIEIEGDEYFTVKLSSSNPLVLVTNEAMVTIVDDDADEVMTDIPNAAATTPSFTTPTVSTPTNHTPGIIQ